MSSAFTKTKLKAARDLIAKKDFAGARDAAQEVLAYEPENYNARVFLGLALLEVGSLELSEQAYVEATKIQPGQVLAWQGLCKFYERTERWEKYAATLRHLMDVFSKSDDAMKCAEQLQRYIDLARRRDDRVEIIEALSLLLPTSAFFPVLSTLPPPDPTSPISTTTLYIQTSIANTLPVLEEIVTLIEKEEESVFKREYDKRRTRLDAANAGPEATRKQIGKAIWSSSKLPDLYNEVINHPRTTDEQRRETESKLLRYKIRLRNAFDLSGDEKIKKLDLTKEIQETVAGAVLIGVSDELAWTIYLDNKDVDEITLYGLDDFRRFVALFPQSSLSKSIRGFFLYTGKRLEPEDEEEKNLVVSENVDAIELVVEALSELPESIIAHRIAAYIHVNQEEYQDLITISENGLQILKRYEVDTGTTLNQVDKAFKVLLASGLVHLFPPKHHKRAIPILDEVLSVDPSNVFALMGRGYILEAAQKWDDACQAFLRVAEQMVDDIDTGLVAREEYAWCMAEQGELDVAREELQAALDNLENLEGYEVRKARIWWRLGVCHWRTNDTEKAYRHFIMALKRSPSFASAFTSLGIYYLEGANPPDSTRATRCFQKAFELDAREVDAAKRLAHAFANEREWDLVKVVAQRVIEGEGGLGGGLSDKETTALARYKPTNAWAWKSLGVVELNNRDYPAAIHALHVALRSDENDAVLWLRLGEAYMKAGRHAAAIKALRKSLELQPDDWVGSYFLGEVHRQMGLFSEAISAFQSVLERASDTTTVLLSLSETHLSQGRAELQSGYLSRASQSFLSAIAVALDLVHSSPGFRRLALKTVVDALTALSGFSKIDCVEVNILDTLLELVGPAIDERLDGIVIHPITPPKNCTDGIFALQLVAIVSSFRIKLFTKEEIGLATAWYDFAAALGKIASTALVDSVREKAQKQAVDSARQALLLAPGNASFWNLFGNLNFVTRPTIAQHAYVRALECNSKDASIWTNLGLFYLHHEDFVLANQALLKAQTLDPDYTLAWVGQGLAAAANGHDEDSSMLFAHAISLAVDIPAADIQYAYRAFRSLPVLSSRKSQQAQDLLLPPFFALDRYCRRITNDASALHLFGLVCERLHLNELATQVMSRAIKQLEVAYEESEDSVIERWYAIANANLGRLRLSANDLEGAIELFETASGLFPSDDTSDEGVSVRALCQFGSGIAFFHMANYEYAVAKFEAAQEIAKDSPFIKGHITILLAKALWEIGTDDFRESAKEQLLDCINNDPSNLTAVIALAAMGLLTNDEALLDATLSEILALPLEKRHARDPERDVDDLLGKHYLANTQYDKAAAVLQSAFHAEPQNARARSNLAAFSISQGRPQIAQALLSKLLESPDQYFTGEGDEALRLLAISLVAKQVEEEQSEEARNEAKRVAQKAVKIGPWETKNWLALAAATNSS